MELSQSSNSHCRTQFKSPKLKIRTRAQNLLYYLVTGVKLSFTYFLTKATKIYSGGLRNCANVGNHTK